MSRAADTIERLVENAAIEALQLSALDLQGAAQRDAPIEEGTLRGAGEAKVEQLPGGGAVATVSFNTPYAAKQEKEDDYVHPRGGKAHYLGDQLKARAPRYKLALQAGVSRALRGR